MPLGTLKLTELCANGTFKDDALIVVDFGYAAFAAFAYLPFMLELDFFIWY